MIDCAECKYFSICENNPIAVHCGSYAEAVKISELEKVVDLMASHIGDSCETCPFILTECDYTPTCNIKIKNYFMDRVGEQNNENAKQLSNNRRRI